MKTTCTNILQILAMVLFAQSALGQTLNETLIQEDPDKLVTQARESGNIVRGAILFHQGNIACAKCHHPVAERDRIGPDLSRMEKNVRETSIVESILQPSKTILKGYETIRVLTVDGEVLTGLVASQDDQKIVLRSGQNSDQQITIERRVISQTQPGAKSSMPDGLVNELKNRQQFLDLLRYVIDIRERGPVADAAGMRSSDRRELSVELQGLVLIDKLNCVACHESQIAVSHLQAKRAPDLKWSASRLDPEFLARFVADPNTSETGTSMPHILGQSSETARTETAEAIVHYLLSLQGNQFQASQDSKPDDGAVRRGNELFHSVGCVACHSPRNEFAIEQPLADSIPLGDLSEKYDAKALAEFLENPHAVRPSGRMPNMLLTHRESLDISSFLVQTREKSGPKPTRQWNLDLALAVQGKQLFSKHGCVKCHTGVDNTPHGLTTQRALAELDPVKGCLSSNRGEWPDFHLSNYEKGQIQAALRSSATNLTNTQQIDLTLASLNCTACHSRNNLGGVPASRSHLFQTTNLNLGEQGRIPPTLSGVGAKLNAKWMRDVLVNHRSIRPYMKTRMPQFGEQNIGHLIDLFQATDHLSETEFATFSDLKEMRKLGLEIAGSKGLNCVACHTYQYKPSDTMPAVDLTEMTERLKKDWFVQYLLAPQKFSPNTVMPSYWPNGKAIRPDIAGDSKYQVEALWQYLIDGRQANAPQGVVRESLEIVVTDEARMLRRSYDGIGKRGIGVGYPGGVNLAYDAEQMRLAMIWKGKFVDPAGVWYGQGHGLVRALGPTLHFPKGPELDDQSDPWIVDDRRPKTHQFKGYILGEARRPTFQYEFGAIKVEDAFSEFEQKETGKIQLRRRIKMISSEHRDGLRFRIAADQSISNLQNRTFQIGSRLTIRIGSDHVGSIVPDAEGTLLHVPLEFENGQVHELVLEYLWEPL